MKNEKKNFRLGKREKKIIGYLGKKGKRNEDQIVFGTEGRGYAGSQFPITDSIKRLHEKDLIRSFGKDRKTGLRVYGLTDKGKITYFNKFVIGDKMRKEGYI